MGAQRCLTKTVVPDTGAFFDTLGEHRALTDVQSNPLESSLKDLKANCSHSVQIVLANACFAAVGHKIGSFCSKEGPSLDD